MDLGKSSSAGGEQQQAHRSHKHTKEGRGGKAAKKDLKYKKDNTHKERHNPRAFSVANAVRTQRSLQRNSDRSQRKEYVPLNDRRSETHFKGPPPLFAVVGPKGVGKSTLIRSLVKIYTNHSLTDVTGPITVVTSKHRRVTFLECPSDDTCAMLDVAKVADLVLLVVDAKFGFEMETFEFLNILQTHGFPKIMGVFTHLDQFRTMKSLRATKKKLKDRFWTEIYDGAKMFHFSGTVNGKYLKNEVRQLTLFLGRVKYRPLVWRNTHPYVVVDRHEDITHPNTIQQNPACHRSITFYGYVRGTHLRESTKVHLLGAGDYGICEMTKVADPCPLLDPNVKTLSSRSKQNLLYAPLSNVGAVTYDKDAVYIDIGQSNYTKKENLAKVVKRENDDDEEVEEEEDSEEEPDYDSEDPAGLLKDLQDVKSGVDEKMRHSTLRIFKGSQAVSSGNKNGDDSDESSSEEEDEETRTDIASLVKPFRRRMPTGEEDDQDSESDSASDDDDDESSDSEEESDEDSDSDQFAKSGRRINVF